MIRRQRVGVSGHNRSIVVDYRAVRITVIPIRVV